MFATLKKLGVRLALDDFGTGYSSLGYLRSAPFDKIKIDQTFVREATLPGSRNGAIIAAIVALAEALGMETTAEGIEYLDQLELIRRLGVSHVQGWVYSKALTSEELSARLDGRQVGDRAQRARRRSAAIASRCSARPGSFTATPIAPVPFAICPTTGALIEGIDEVPAQSLDHRRPWRRAACLCDRGASGG